MQIEGATGRRVSRKPVADTADQTKAMPVRFSPEMLARMKAAANGVSLAAFIRQAVEQELRRREGEE